MSKYLKLGETEQASDVNNNRQLRNIFRVIGAVEVTIGLTVGVHGLLALNPAHIGKGALCLVAGTVTAFAGEACMVGPEQLQSPTESPLQVPTVDSE